MSAPTKNIPAAISLQTLLTRNRWVEIGRIVLTGLIAILYWQDRKSVV